MKMIFRKHRIAPFQTRHTRVREPETKKSNSFFPGRMHAAALAYTSDVAESMRDSMKLRKTIKKF